MKKNTKIEVTWWDIIEESAWTEEGDIDDVLPECRTLGYFFCQTDQILTLSGTMSGKERSYTKIPVGCIKEIKLVYSRKQRE